MTTNRRPPRLDALVRPLERWVNRIYGSEKSPLYSSGSLAALFLAIALVSGLYLFLFYKVADPYASVEAIEKRVWFGGFVRAMHRYSADLALVAAVLHLVKRLAMGHTSGPRTVAWRSGVFLLGAVLFCGWTGFVMVWDVQAQLVAAEGARLLDLLPIFSTSIGRSFSGAHEVSRSFFFMNLFLHVAIPLGLAALLWLHLSRLPRPRLWPARAMTWYVLGTLALFSALVGVELPPAAHLQIVPSSVPTDVFYAFWLHAARALPPGAHLALWLAGFSLLVAVPRLRRHQEVRPAPSVVEERFCSGCTQCYVDCPYDAIAMVPRGVPSRLSELVARVDPDLCVACGICSGSCAPMGVGPPGQTGREQIERTERFLEEHPVAAETMVVAACGHGPAAGLDTRAGGTVVELPIGCAGALHTSVLELVLRRGAGGVLVVTCPDRDCLNREGPKWLRERVYEDREAELRDRVDKRRVRLVAAARTEPEIVAAALAELRATMNEIGTVQAEDRVVLDLKCEVAIDA